MARNTHLCSFIFSTQLLDAIDFTRGVLSEKNGMTVTRSDVVRSILSKALLATSEQQQKKNHKRNSRRRAAA